MKFLEFAERTLRRKNSEEVIALIDNAHFDTQKDKEKSIEFGNNRAFKLITKEEQTIKNKIQKEIK